MKKILEILRRKWAEYLLEVIVIVIGILGAFGLNSWNEDRLSNKLETEMLREIWVGLESDVNDLDYNLKAHIKTLKSQTIVARWLTSDLPYDDSLAYHFGRINNSTIFKSNEGPYETLKQLGIRLITLDSLRDQILDVYDRQFHYYLDVLSQYNALDLNMMTFINHKHFNTWQFGHPINPLNLKAIKSDTEYLYHVNMLRSFNNFLIERSIKPTKKKAEETIEMIEAELAKR